MKVKVCMICHTNFNTKRKHANTCSSTCRSKKYSLKHKNKVINKKCKYCDVSFFCYGQSVSRLYCSDRCKNQFRYISDFNSNERIKKNLRSRLYDWIVGKNKREASAVKDLGCSIEELKTHLENLFQEGMTWENYGLKGWHIDHIKPLALFNLSDPKEQKKACHYTNLQPLWAKDNLSKGAKYEYK